ncbi:metallophosphoesterase [Legionella cincinnatiensis]|uniref:Sphingomyelin phosphodiesterase n=1 Tax=Legionella cincinnatiensis TaxID=28085 RepID=A0A378IGH2_9GAMM|nr:metallophosphoesterase [Legionella cincinnatiensis]KTC84798.1 sphingomyelin phosphodiesterase [Legionella cincinnatiensis]STX34309.1 sphingomyelin phosphodiesterase [Legionella cincinnatiensis]
MKSLFKLIFLISWFIHAAYANLNFLTISDIHYGENNVARDGEDTGPEFLNITMKKFKKLSKQVDFILCLGDLPTHSLFNTTTKGAYEKKVFDELYVNDVGLKPIFYVTGNNDSLSGNYQPFRANGVSPLNFATNWHGACAHCKELIINDDHMYHDGYYSSYVIPGNKKIILIALNANQWAETPLLSPYPHQKKDALEQLSWLNQQLKEHHAEQLLIAMHEPPGDSYIGKPVWRKQYLKKFINILNKNQQSYGEITLLTSHSHMDEFRKIHLDNGTNIYGFSTPGISRNHHNYPGMKVFSLNKKMKVDNFTTYYTSHLDKWGNQQYQALNNPNAIFPYCRNKTLSQCLNELNMQQICDYEEQGLFYGVKSPIVPNDCNKVYKVN